MLQFNMVARGAFMEVTSEERPGGGEGGSHGEGYQRKSNPGGRHRCKGPGAGLGQESWRNSNESICHVE